MCGIAGFLDLHRRGAPPDADLSSDTLRAMVSSLVHRGPDDEGFYGAPGVGLGMRRLAVIDLDGGRQPMANEDATVWVVTNGEIYNFVELRDQLRDRGHRFVSESDTEVLVHGWEEWGTDLPRRLRGMFAFAVWDTRTEHLFVARDPFGVKPLYYSEQSPGTPEHRLLFGSEIKALLAAGVERRLDLQALDGYLSFLYVPEPRTLFESVRVLPPGHALSCRGGTVELQSYARYEPSGDRFASRREAVEAVREVLDDSVRAMMVADVPVGLFLSAGIDSASLLAAMVRHGDGPVKTFSIGFGQAEHRWDELDGARSLAEHFGSDHHEIRVEPDIVQQLPRVVRHFDQPFANPTAVILDLLSQRAREQVTVALSGTGGDEFFAGYPRHLGMALYRRYRYLPEPVRRAAAVAGRALLRDATDGRQAARRLRRFLAGGALPLDRCYAEMLVALGGQRKQGLYSEPTLEALRMANGGTLPDATEWVRQRFPDRRPSGALEYLLAADVGTYLVGNQLAYADRMSMAQSLEVRVPFVDQRVAEVASRIPLAWHLRRGVTKSLLRDAVAPWLPESIVKAPKRGLNLPIGLWFRGALEPWMRDLLGPGHLGARGLLDGHAVDALIAEHLGGRRDHSLALWALVVLELWFQEYLPDQGASSAHGSSNHR